MCLTTCETRIRIYRIHLIYIHVCICVRGTNPFMSTSFYECQQKQRNRPQNPQRHSLARTQKNKAKDQAHRYANRRFTDRFSCRFTEMSSERCQLDSINNGRPRACLELARCVCGALYVMYAYSLKILNANPGVSKKNVCEAYRSRRVRAFAKHTTHTLTHSLLA